MKQLRQLSFPLLALGALLATTGFHAAAQVMPSPVTPVVGNGTTVSADPTVPRPSTNHCTVTLFSNEEFADFNTKNFTYTPPSTKVCPGPWSKVVLTVDYTVTKGTQYDRTAQFYLGGAILFFGTTAEPRNSLIPFWHVESDVTDLAPLLTSTQAGTALLGNYVGVYDGVDYNGIIYATANLEFYNTNAENPPAAVPNQVIGLTGNGGSYALNNPTSVYTQSLTLPTNVIGAFLDVYAQSQSDDEFWYTCVPSALSAVLESCGDTGFRETEITIDGTPAGVAPVYPWIYTGGIDPFLWEPIPGVQTLNLKPFRVDLTPFSGQLSNGKTHTVGVQVYNADSYFSLTGNLLLYTDPVLTKVTGEVTENTLTAEPTPEIVDNITTDTNGDAYGSVTTKSNRSYKIQGNVSTSQGLKVSVVSQAVTFDQTALFTVNESEDVQDITQSTTAYGGSTTYLGGVETSQVSSFSYPFTLDYSFVANPNGTYAQATKASQQWLYGYSQSAGGVDQYQSSTSNTVTSQDTLNYDANFNFTGNTGTQSKQTYNSLDSEGNCYSRTLTAANLKLTGLIDGAACQ
jgi:hypothetical protein